MGESEKLLDIDLHSIYDAHFDEASLCKNIISREEVVSLLERHIEKSRHQHFCKQGLGVLLGINMIL
jgi:hypothetical protein